VWLYIQSAVTTVSVLSAVLHHGGQTCGVSANATWHHYYLRSHKTRKARSQMRRCLSRSTCHHHDSSIRTRRLTERGVPDAILLPAGDARYRSNGSDGEMGKTWNCATAFRIRQTLRNFTPRRYFLKSFKNSNNKHFWNARRFFLAGMKAKRDECVLCLVTWSLDTTRPSTIFYRMLLNWASLRRH
jgi:hypothetical protein